MPMNDAARDDALTGGQALVRRLTAEGVDTVFLIPGVQLDWAVDALAQTPGMRMIVPRHEQSASYMADGYARVSGKAGVAMVVPGPGILNAGAGLATAYACNSPVLMLVGQIHADSVAQGHGNLHELRDQTRVLEGIVKWNARVTARDRLESTLNAAFREMFNGRTGPVSVEIPYNFLIENAPPGTPLPPGAPDPARAPDARAIRAAADLLNDAEFPLVYVGGGSAGAIDQIRELADRIGLPVIGSENARGHLPDSHPLSFTELEGRELFARADVVLVLASRFMEAMTARPSWPQKGKRWIYLNCESAHLSAPRKADCAICADASLGLRSLLPLLKRHEVVSQAESGRIKARADERISALGDLASYVGALRRALPRNGIFVNELTQVGYLARVAFRVEDPATYIGPGYQGTLGYAYPTALGAAIAGAGRRVYAISGDGGFGWSCSEMATAMRYDLPVTLVVFNDGHFGNVRGIQRRTFGREAAVALRNPDFEKLAAAYEMPFARADGPAALEAALKRSNALAGPMLIEAPVGEMASPWPLLRLRPPFGTDETDDDTEAPS